MAIKSGDIRIAMDPVATAQTQRAARDHLNSLCSGDLAALHQGLPAFVKLLFESDGDTIGAFVEVLDDGTLFQRVVVAGGFFVALSESPRLISERSQQKCTAVLIEAIKSGDVAARHLACIFLALGEVLPAEVIEPLEELTHDADMMTATLSAFALSRSPHDDSHGQFYGLSIIVKALLGRNDSLAAMAGTTLLRLGVRNEDALRELKQHFSLLAPLVKQHVLQMAMIIGEGGIGLFDEVAEVVADSGAGAGIRQIAAAALGSICRNDNRACAPLLRALESSRWQLVLGAVHGLSYNRKGIPREVIVKLMRHLDSPKSEMRRTIAYSLGLIPKRAAEVVPQMIERLGKESDPAVCKVMSMSLTAIGETAVPHLMAVIVAGDIIRTHYASDILVTIGQAAASKIAEVVPRLHDERVVRIFVKILSWMGSGAVPAVPLMAAMLDVTHDDEVALDLARGIYLCGTAAVEAVPALVRCVARRETEDDQLRACAVLALFGMKNCAIPALRAAISGADGQARERLQSVLGELESTKDKASDRLSGVSRKDIARFVRIADVMQRSRPISVRRIATAIKEEETAGVKSPRGKVRKNRTGLAANSIWRLLDKLETVWGVRLTTHVRPIPGQERRRVEPGDLTAGGLTYAQKARDELRL